jgi:hypothetical protein
MTSNFETIMIHQSFESRVGKEKKKEERMMALIILNIWGIVSFGCQWVLVGNWGWGLVEKENSQSCIVNAN